MKCQNIFLTFVTSDSDSDLNPLDSGNLKVSTKMSFFHLLKKYCIFYLF